MPDSPGKYRFVRDGLFLVLVLVGLIAAVYVTDSRINRAQHARSTRERNDNKAKIRALEARVRTLEMRP